MASSSVRQRDILSIARSSGSVSVQELARRFDVTPQTIRNDLNELSRDGALNRFHGGALPASGITNVGYEARRQLSADPKRRIGEVASTLIPSGASVFINIGTTTEAVAVALCGHEQLMVITNNINVAYIMRGHERLEVVVSGGVLRHSDGALVGEHAVDFINQFRADFAIIGASGIDEDGYLLDYDYREVKVAKSIIQAARTTILVADHTKFERTAPVKIAHISSIHHLVTDENPPEAIRALCTQGGIALHLPPETISG